VMALVVIVIAVALVSNVSNTTGKATGEYDGEWWDCWNDDDCDFGELCIDHNCVQTESNLGVIFGCNPVNDEGTNFLDCSGFVANQAMYDYGITAENVVLFGGFFTEDSNVDLTRVWTKQGECISNVEIAGMITDAVEKIFRYGHSSLPSEDLIFKNPDTSLYCNIGNVEQFFDFGPFSDTGYSLTSVPSSKTVGFNMKAIFEDEVPNVVVCAVSTQTWDADYMHFLPNCWFWYPEGVDYLLPGLGACFYEEYGDLDNGENEIACEDRSWLSCESELTVYEWFEGEYCNDEGAIIYEEEPLGPPSVQNGGNLLCKEGTLNEAFQMDNVEDFKNGFSCFDLGACCDSPCYDWESDEGCYGLFTQGVMCDDIPKDDDDVDGYYAQPCGEDCNDDNPGINPSVTEICDGVDNDCDGYTDEGLTQQCGSSDMGECEYGTETCTAGSWGACVGEVGPTTEVCNGLDDDCDGTVDEGLTQQCGTDVGECEYGTETCSAGSWGSCVGEVGQTTEVCNGLDDDCDGTVDEGLGCEACCYDDGNTASISSYYGPSVIQCTDALPAECTGNFDGTSLGNGTTCASDGYLCNPK